MWALWVIAGLMVWVIGACAVGIVTNATLGAPAPWLWPVWWMGALVPYRLRLWTYRQWVKRRIRREKARALYMERRAAIEAEERAKGLPAPEGDDVGRLSLAGTTPAAGGQREVG